MALPTPPIDGGSTEPRRRPLGRSAKLTLVAALLVLGALPVWIKAWAAPSIKADVDIGVRYRLSTNTTAVGECDDAGCTSGSMEIRDITDAQLTLDLVTPEGKRQSVSIAGNGVFTSPLTGELRSDPAKKPEITDAQIDEFLKGHGGSCKKPSVADARLESLDLIGLAP